VQEVAEHEHHRQYRKQRDKRRQACLGGDYPDTEGTDDRQVAVGEVDDAHDTEHQRQSAGEQGIQAAEGETEPASTLSSVVFPAPFGPTTPIASDEPTEKSTWLSTCRSP
jgi:hypothetical protein